MSEGGTESPAPRGLAHGGSYGPQRVSRRTLRTPQIIKRISPYSRARGIAAIVSMAKPSSGPQPISSKLNKTIISMGTSAPGYTMGGCARTS